MFSIESWASFGEAAKTAAGFFWKSGWAFVLGYFISAMIQAFIPKGRLTPYLGGSGAKSVGLATAFGALSSSCSFAALAAARALVMKGAHFVAAVAFMFASTNLDYTFWMNAAAVGLVGWLSWLNHSWHRKNEEAAMEMGGGWIKKTLAWTALTTVAAGIVIHFYLLINPPALD